MAGANAAAHNTSTVVVSRQPAAHRHGLVERLVARYRAHTERTRAEELARMTWTDEPWHRSSGQAADRRDLGSTPLRGVRLT